MRASFAVFLFLAFAVLVHPEVEADALEIEISDLQAARLLVQAGELQDAKYFLLQARPKNEAEWIERLFLLGQIEMRLGQPRLAATRYETILDRRPDLTRIRLELASAYFAAGIDDQAKLQFNLSQAENLPSSVEGAVNSYLRAIDARKPWSASFSAALLPGTKPRMRPDGEVITVGGIPFELDPDDRPASGMGLRLFAGASYSPMMSDDLRGLLAISGSGDFYDHSVWNDASVAIDLGITQLFDQGSLSTGFRFGWQWTESERTRRSIGVWSRIRTFPSESTRFDMPIELEFRKYDRQQFRDGTALTVNPGLTFALSNRTLLGMDVRLGLTGAEAAHHEHRVVGLGLSVKHEFAGGFSISMNPAMERRRYSKLDPLFGVKRDDQRITLSLGLRHRSIRYRGFTPSINFSYEKNDSNIVIREHEDRQWNINFSKNF